MSDKATGLFQKYRVERVDGKDVRWCFVLEDKDPLAIPALRAYATSAKAAGYEALASDLFDVAAKLCDASERQRMNEGD